MVVFLVINCNVILFSKPMQVSKIKTSKHHLAHYGALWQFCNLLYFSLSETKRFYPWSGDLKENCPWMHFLDSLFHTCYLNMVEVTVLLFSLVIKSVLSNSRLVLTAFSFSTPLDENKPLAGTADVNQHLGDWVPILKIFWLHSCSR